MPDVQEARTALIESLDEYLQLTWPVGDPLRKMNVPLAAKGLANHVGGYVDAKVDAARRQLLGFMLLLTAPLIILTVLVLGTA